jgi:hypothetical protein
MDTFDSNFGSPRSAVYIAAAMATSALLLLTSISVSSFGQMAPPMQSTTGGNMTGSTTNANTTTSTASQSACANQTQTAAGTNMTTSRNTTTSGNATMMAGGNNNMSSTAGMTSPASQAASEVRLHIEEACKALQSNDNQGALMHLNLAIMSLDSVEANLNSTATGGNASNATMTSGANQTGGM